MTMRPRPVFTLDFPPSLLTDDDLGELAMHAANFEKHGAYRLADWLTELRSVELRKREENGGEPDKTDIVLPSVNLAEGWDSCAIGNTLVALTVVTQDEQINPKVGDLFDKLLLLFAQVASQFLLALQNQALQTAAIALGGALRIVPPAQEQQS
jgi:hypothetical protein